MILQKGVASKNNNRNKRSMNEFRAELQR
jgi:hypothetical protein